MKYEKVKKCLAEYDTLYSHGMNKEANRELQELCLWIDSLSSNDSDEILNPLVTDICETEAFASLFKRGNGQLPFQLKKIIQKWLMPGCRQGKMPELRWYYQIYRNDSDNAIAEYAFSCLDSAYENAPDDGKTQELLFERNVEALEFGIHELPLGLLISDDDAQLIFRQCDAIIQHGYAKKNLIDRYSASKREYDEYIKLKNGSFLSVSH